MNTVQEYQSGMGKGSQVPPELNGWNWGAVLMNWIWGIGNGTYIALLMFVPFVNFALLVVLGLKGNEWAWRNRVWRDVAHFKQVQKRWAIVGAVFYLVLMPLLCIPLLNLLKGDAYHLSLRELEKNVEVQEMLGEPLTPGFFVLGTINYQGSGGEAALQYTLTGSKGSAEVYVHAARRMKTWSLTRLVVYSEDQDRRIFVPVSNKQEVDRTPIRF